MTNLSPVDWARRPLENYADFTGRAPRAEYWWFTLALVAAYIVLSIVESIVGLKGMVLGYYGPLTALLWLATIVPSLAVAIRRLHDTSRSGWWMLLVLPYCVSVFMVVRATMAGDWAGFGMGGLVGLVGFVCCIVLLIFMVLPSTPGDNKFGSNPYGDGAGSAAAE